MATLSELSTFLNILFAETKVNDYCPNGLQVEGGQQIQKIGTGVTATLETIQNAVDQGVQALIVHHGLFWNKDPYEITGTKLQKLKLLIKNNISLFAYHLPLDAHQQIGNNWKAAKDMNWKNLEPFGFYNGNPIGVKGSVANLTQNQLQKLLEEYYGHPAFCAWGGKKKIKTIGLISGGAYRNITDAITDELDCFITGNFDEPAWNIAHEEKINFCALGHTATERVGPKALGEYVAGKLKLKHVFIDSQNPF